MKKKSIFAIAFGAFVVATGLSSCKKDKDKDCVEYSQDSYTDCFCVGDFENRDAFDAYVESLQEDGYSIKYVESCPEVEL